MPKKKAVAEADGPVVVMPAPAKTKRPPTTVQRKYFVKRIQELAKDYENQAYTYAEGIYRLIKGKDDDEDDAGGEDQRLEDKIKQAIIEGTLDLNKCTVFSASVEGDEDDGYDESNVTLTGRAIGELARVCREGGVSLKAIEDSEYRFQQRYRDKMKEGVSDLCDQAMFSDFDSEIINTTEMKIRGRYNEVIQELKDLAVAFKKDPDDMDAQYRRLERGIVRD